MSSSNIYFVEQNGNYKFEIPRDGLTIVDNNSEFTDGFFVGWSYPMERYLTDKMKRDFGDLSNPHILQKKDKDWGYLSLEGELYPGSLNFESCQNKLLKNQIEFGYENLKCFEKKLSELPLQVIVNGLGSSYALDSIESSFPYYNMGFPKVIKRKDGVPDAIFNNLKPDLSGFYDGPSTDGSEWIGMKPYVYIMHILEVGFATENLILEGDIYNDDDLMHSMLNHTNSLMEKVEVVGGSHASVVILPDPNKFYGGVGYFVEKVVDYSFTGLQGNFYFSVLESAQDIVEFSAIGTYIEGGVTKVIQLLLNETTIPGEISVQKAVFFSSSTDVHVQVKVKVLYKGKGNDLKKELEVYMNPAIGSGSSAGWKAKTKNFIASDCVPDITFGDLVKAVMAKGHYRIDIFGNRLVMSKITNVVDEAIDLSFSEIEDVEVVQLFRDGYFMQLEAPDDYNFEKYGITTEGIITTMESQGTFESLTLPYYVLPLTKTVDDNYGGYLFGTACEYTEENSKVCFIKYGGLTAGNQNVALNPEGFLVPAVYINYINWIQNRLRASLFKWSFKTNNPVIRMLASRHKIKAYSMFHKIVKLTKKYIQDDSYEVHIESENRY